MSYYFSKVLNRDFNESIEEITEGLKKEGFGILTEIDVKQTFKNKLSIDYPDYKIFGACNPTFAHKALEAENKIGTLLPCNVIVRKFDEERTEVAAVDPVASMQSVGNPDLTAVAEHIGEKLKRVINSL